MVSNKLVIDFMLFVVVS